MPNHLAKNKGLETGMLLTLENARKLSQARKNPDPATPAHRAVSGRIEDFIGCATRCAFECQCHRAVPQSPRRRRPRTAEYAGRGAPSRLALHQRRCHIDT